MASERMDAGRERRARARDALLRRTRTVMVAVSAAAVALSGALSVVAAQAFKGHQADPAPPAARSARRGVDVPKPEPIPAIAGQPAPLQPPAAPPSAATPEPAPPAPAPQVSGGS